MISKEKGMTLIANVNTQTLYHIILTHCMYAYYYND